MKQSVDVNPHGILATNTFHEHANSDIDACMLAVNRRVVESNAMIRRPPPRATPIRVTPALRSD
jgi:hypothetical protein